MNRNRKVILAVLVSFVLVSTALALTPMGPPVASLEKGQFSAGVDYAYGKTGVKLNHGTGANLTGNNVRAHYVGANIGYGIRKNWDLSFKLGGGSVRGSRTGGVVFNSDDDGYAIGLGTKFTTCTKENIKWGGLVQILWAQADGKVTTTTSRFKADENLVELQFAFGPAYQMNEKTLLYGGPFIHVLDGDVTAKGAGTRIKYDLDQDGWFGGYIGGQIDITKRTAFSIEYQHTRSADVLGMNITYKF